jgi:glucose-1-phosphate thymidylyltransferase
VTSVSRLGLYSEERRAECHHLVAMKGVVLAAGKGTRLYPITRSVPKPLLPLANRTTLAYAFDRLKECGIEEVCIVVGENEPAVREALGDGTAFGVRLGYARQVEPKGLAHAVSFAQEFVAGDDFVLYLGDAVYGQSLKPFVDRFRESGCSNLNLVKPVEDPRRFGVANVDGERIVKLVEKPQQPESNLAMAGMYVFGPQIWSVLPDLQPSGRGEYEITDAIQTLIDRGETVLAGVYEGEWFDTGTLDSFLETTRFMTGGRPLVGGGAIVQAEMGENVVIGEGAVVEAPLIEDSVVFPGAVVRAAGPIRHSLLQGRVESGSGLEGVIRDGESDA